MLMEINIFLMFMDINSINYDYCVTDINVGPSSGNKKKPRPSLLYGALIATSRMSCSNLKLHL